ncbi:MAG TPA: hypothetical protein P5234_13315 [Thermoanaerobaculaceae bacterium]|nr:hypothetical protein [Thermoanaerobaculaceae bacterium]HRS17212.1 hypothetical protein [Thermoanaerobaculaceae bacterium]
MTREKALIGAWGLGWALVYLGTLTARYAFDGVAYCGEIVLALSRGSLREVVHTGHLLFSPLALLWVRLTGGLDSELAVHLRLQVLQALLGAAAVTALMLLLRRRVAAPVAGAVAAAFGFTYAFWRYTTDVEAYSVVALTVIAALAATLRAAETPTPASATAAGLACGLATLGHLTSGLFAAVTLPLLMAWAPVRRLRVGLAFSAAYASLVGAVLGTVALGPAAAGRPEGRLGFLLGYMQAGSREEAFGWPWRQIPSSLATVAHALVASTPAWLVVLIAPLVVGLAAGAVIATRRRSPRERRAAVVASWWLGAHTLFYFAWECNEKYWVAALVPGALLLALACDAGLRRLAVGWRAAPAILLAAGLLAANLPAIRHDMVPANNRVLQLALSLRAATPPGSQVVLSGLDPWRELKVYVPYFAERTPVILDFALAPSRREDLAALVARIPEPDAPPTFALGELIDTPGARSRLEARHALPPGSLAARLRALCLRPLHTLAGGETLYRLGGCATPPSGR